MEAFLALVSRKQLRGLRTTQNKSYWHLLFTPGWCLFCFDYFWVEGLCPNYASEESRVSL